MEMLHQSVVLVPQLGHWWEPLELAVQQWVDCMLCNTKSDLMTPCIPTLSLEESPRM